MSTVGLGLSAVFVLASDSIFYFWSPRHWVGVHEAAARVLSCAAVCALVAATGWLGWQIISFGVHDTPASSHGHAVFGSIFGVPVIVVPLAVLVAMVGVAELVARTVGASPVPSPSNHAAAAGGSMERPSLDLRSDYPYELPTPARQRKIGQRAMKGSRELLGYFSRAEQQTVEAIRGEVAAGGAHSRTTLADAISQIESRLSDGLEQHARFQTSTQDAVGRLQETVTDSAAKVTRALEGVSEVCARVADQIEAHRLERHLLTDAVALLARPVSRPLEVPPRAVVTEPELAIVEDDEVEPAPDPAPATVTYERWREPIYETTAMRTSVKRLRERAQQAGRQMWTRARANRPGSNPPA
ncbi:MAG TPA: hypothetical protein VK771_05605 [Acidimicrobiia bacterium]|nr:hypothetical protein [Acidimicrobiia bacterium]